MAIMARKRKNEGAAGCRPKGASRERAVLSIVATDNTFCPDWGSPRLETGEFQPRQQVGWVGRCIHCNTRVYVGVSGWTQATVEHINPLCAGGDNTDPRNLALACQRCNNEKGVRHDQHVGKGGRADEVIIALQGKRLARWREPIA